MNSWRRWDDGRRRWLKRLLAGSALGVVPVPVIIRQVLAAGRAPGGRGIIQMEGQVTVNAASAQPGMPVRAGDTVATGAGSSAVLVIGKDAFLIRERSRLEISGAGLAVTALRMVTGKLLSVFGGGSRTIHTATATIGIRGTGIYVESEPERSYVCTCYGAADLQATAMPEARETVVTRHHDAPRYIYAHGDSPIKMIERAPVVNHSDQELILLEALVGRAPPFIGKEGKYGAAGGM